LFKIRFHKNVFKDLDNLPGNEVERIAEQIERLKTNPFPPGFKKLSGKDGIYRIRQGNYRVVYSVDQKEREIIIWAVRHRKDVYR